VSEIEARLVHLTKQGDQQAFSELVDIYQNKLYQLGYRMLGNKQEAEDVVQETFLRVYLNLDQYQDKYKFSSWIFRIATNFCIDRLRQRKHVVSLDLPLNTNETNDHQPFVPRDEDTPEKQVILNETQAYIQKKISLLPSQYKSIVILKYLNDFSVQEISEILHLPVGTVKVRLHRAREYLRTKIQAKEM
jgi:RNA polymerase sigma-70 factor (ECF subfamily)